MPRYPRVHAQGLLCHVMARGNDGRGESPSEGSERGAARSAEPQTQRANCEDGGGARPVYLPSGVGGRLSSLRVGKFPRLPPVEREPGVAERSGELESQASLTQKLKNPPGRKWPMEKTPCSRPSNVSRRSSRFELIQLLLPDDIRVLPLTSTSTGFLGKPKRGVQNRFRCGTR